MSIGYAFRPRLRSRLTLGGRPFPRKPYNPGRTTLPQETLVNWWMGFSPIIVTYTGILTSMRSTAPFGTTSPHMERSPTTLDYSKIRNFGIMLSPGKSSARRHSTYIV